MNLLWFGLTLFFLLHMLPWAPALRDALIARLGRLGYQGGFALLSAVGLALMVFGYGRAPYTPLYTPPSWGGTAALALMLPAAVLLVAAYTRNNVHRFTRHPMLWGVSLWALAHLLAKGDLASALLFGSFLVYALLDMVAANLRGARKSTTPAPLSRDAFAVVIGLVLYSGMLRLHPFLFGVSPLH